MQPRSHKADTDFLFDPYEQVEPQLAAEMFSKQKEGYRPARNPATSAELDQDSLFRSQTMNATMAQMDQSRRASAEDERGQRLRIQA